MSNLIKIEPSIKIINQDNSGKTDSSNGKLQLSKIQVDEKYCQEWGIRLNDFVCLTKNGQLISNNLYRVGGLGTPNLEKDNYFMLLKYVEAYYDKEILKMSKSNKAKHLDGRWTIIDKNGVEKYEHKKGLDHPYLVKDSCIYHISSKYYNIETGEYYGDSNRSIESREFLFIENRYDFHNEDKSKIGVLKINKQDGSYELFPI